jgi:hypothetical protein
MDPAGRRIGRTAVLVAAAMFAVVTACSIGANNTDLLKGLGPGMGRLAGKIGPGVPPNGTVPNMMLVFTDGNRTVRAVARDGSYQVDLPAGVWNVTGPVGVCATGIHVSPAAWQSDDLGYPMAQCQDLSVSPSPSSPPKPPGN